MEENSIAIKKKNEGNYIIRAGSSDKEKHYRKAINKATKSADNLKRLNIYAEDERTRENLKDITEKMISETRKKEKLKGKMVDYACIAGTIAGAAIGYYFFNELANDMEGQMTTMDNVYKYLGIGTFTAMGTLTGRLAGLLSLPKLEKKLENRIKRYEAFYDALQR
ncbi:MAG: hypothetical protein ACQEP1_05965 [Nanobdellota archaeon]